MRERKRCTGYICTSMENKLNAKVSIDKVREKNEEERKRERERGGGGGGAPPEPDKIN